VWEYWGGWGGGTSRGNYPPKKMQKSVTMKDRKGKEGHNRSTKGPMRKRKAEEKTPVPWGRTYTVLRNGKRQGKVSSKGGTPGAEF